MALGATVVMLASVAGSIVLAPTTDADTNALAFTGFVAASGLVGYLVASRRPDHPVGWLLVVVGLGFAVQDVTARIAFLGLVAEPGSVPGAGALVWPQTWLWVPPTTALLVLLPLHFPDGHLPSSRWRPLVWLAVVWTIAVAVLSAVTPGDGQLSVGVGSGLENPLGIESLRRWGWVVEQVAPTALLALAIPAVASLVMRFRRSDGQQRAQLKWLAYSLISSLTILPLAGLLIPALDPVASLVFAAIPMAVGVAVLRHRLYDIDLLINRTLVFVSLTVVLLGVYVGVVAATSAVAADQTGFGPAIVAAGLVAVLFAPARARAQAGVNRLMYGERDDPRAALSRLGQQLEATLTVDAVLPTVVATVAGTLKVPYVAIEVQRDGTALVVAEHGTRATPDEALLRLPLRAGGETVGSLLVAPRTGDSGFSRADGNVLQALARQVGVAAHAVLLHDEARRLADDLQRSRQRLVVTREEERRRLGRDLHDEIGPRLAGLAMQVDAARLMLHTEPVRAEALLVEVLEQTSTAMESVRRVAYALRPPALDSLGLVDALRSHLSDFDRTVLDVEIDAPATLPALPAAVEIAAYRIVLEALNNVRRHARARRCTVAVSLDGPQGPLTVTVTDDGCGGSQRWAPGVGLTSMRERAAELGGACTIEPLPVKGTQVSVCLPLECRPPAIARRM